jgi:hypothetical protein
MPTSELRFPARFDPDAFGADLKSSTPAGRTAAETARRNYERNGVPRSQLAPCETEGRDGTRLPGCVKIYIPQPAGHFGMVFKWVIHETGPRLKYLAFGARHHPKDSHAPTVYEIAHQRLNQDGATPETPNAAREDAAETD